MKKSASILLLAVISSSALADWEMANRGTSTTTYLDLSSRQVTVSTVKMWHLNDNVTLKQVNGGKAFLSLKAQIEYDCTKKKTRYLWTSVYSGHMGSGELLDSLSGNQVWQPVAPNTVWEILFKSACLKS